MFPAEIQSFFMRFLQKYSTRGIEQWKIKIQGRAIFNFFHAMVSPKNKALKVLTYPPFSEGWEGNKGGRYSPLPQRDLFYAAFAATGAAMGCPFSSKFCTLTCSIMRAMIFFSMESIIFVRTA